MEPEEELSELINAPEDDEQVEDDPEDDEQEEDAPDGDTQESDEPPPSLTDEEIVARATEIQRRWAASQGKVATEEDPDQDVPEQFRGDEYATAIYRAAIEAAQSTLQQEIARSSVGANVEAVLQRAKSAIPEEYLDEFEQQLRSEAPSNPQAVMAILTNEQAFNSVVTTFIGQQVINSKGKRKPVNELKPSYGGKPGGAASNYVDMTQSEVDAWKKFASVFCEGLDKNELDKERKAWLRDERNAMRAAHE